VVGLGTGLYVVSMNPTPAYPIGGALSLTVQHRGASTGLVEGGLSALGPVIALGQTVITERSADGEFADLRTRLDRVESLSNDTLAITRQIANYLNSHPLPPKP
jgi:hypothetical protein